MTLIDTITPLAIVDTDARMRSHYTQQDDEWNQEPT